MKDERKRQLEKILKMIISDEKEMRQLGLTYFAEIFSTMEIKYIHEVYNKMKISKNNL